MQNTLTTATNQTGAISPNSGLKTSWALTRAHITAGKTRILLLAMLLGMLMNTFFVTVVFAWSAISLLNRNEAAHQSDAMYLSLPVTRDHVVWSRFISSAVVIALGFALGYIVAGLEHLGMALDSENLSIAGNTLLTLYPFVLLISVFYPLYFRYGYTTGIYLSTFMLMTPVFVFKVYILHVLSNIFAGKDVVFSGFLPGKDALLNKVGKTVIGAYQMMGSLWFTLFLMVMMAVMVAVSIKLSLQFYRRREFK